ncbi:armadillo-type protein [Mycena leptocephala]|nr:armadillo-type protein [Mycena leptocephala]
MLVTLFVASLATVANAYIWPSPQLDALLSLRFEQAIADFIQPCDLFSFDSQGANPHSGRALRLHFRTLRQKLNALLDIAGSIVEFSIDRLGSPFIQNELPKASSKEIQSVFDEIVPDNTLRLIQDVFGNYVIQRLFKHGTRAQKTMLANIMAGHVLFLSCNLYGCRVVQQAIQSILPEQQDSFVRELEPHILRCVKDRNGNHVIRKVIEHVPPERLGFISTFTDHVLELAFHQFGYRVLQRCLQYLPDVQMQPRVDELLASDLWRLMQDQYGNYVIQWILEYGQRPEDKALIAAQLRGHLLFMAQSKFASNVCEKVLLHADSASRHALIEEIMAPPSEPDTATPTHNSDASVDYVLLRALAVAEGNQKETLINAVRPQLLSMRSHSAIAHSERLTSFELELEKLSPSNLA